MAHLEVSLTDDERRFVERRVAEAGFGSASDYFSELIRRDRDCARERLKALLLEGLASKSFEATDEWWEKKRLELEARVLS